MDKQNEQADKPGPYVDIDALNKGDAKVIEKTASDWPKLNQRQRDKIRHNIQKPVYDAIVTMAKNNLAATINISEITHDARRLSDLSAFKPHIL